MVKVLNHGNQVKKVNSNNWQQPIRVFALKGHCEEEAKLYNEPSRYEEALERAIKFGHELASTYEEMLSIPLINAEEKAFDFRFAIPLAEGEEVEIEGRRYTVQYYKYGSCSNPILFIPVKK